MRKTVKLNDQEKHWLKEAKLLMMLADEQEKSDNMSDQKEAVHNRVRLATMLQKLHIIRPTGQEATDRENQLTELWDDWSAGHTLPGADLLGRVHGHSSREQRILDYVKTQNPWEGDYRRLARAIGCTLTTTHDAVSKLVKEKKISVDQLTPRKMMVMVL